MTKPMDAMGTVQAPVEESPELSGQELEKVAGGGKSLDKLSDVMKKIDSTQETIVQTEKGETFAWLDRTIRAGVCVIQLPLTRARRFE